MSLLGLRMVLLARSQPPHDPSPQQVQRGQGPVECVVMVLLVAVVAIAGVTLLAP